MGLQLMVWRELLTDLFFTKGESTKEVWYYEHPYPPGYKSYSKTKPLRIEEFEPEKKWWHERKETEQAWKVSALKIIESGYDLDIMNPNAPEGGPGDPDLLLTRYQEVIGEAVETRDRLKSVLEAALGGN